MSQTTSVLEPGGGERTAGQSAVAATRPRVVRVAIAGCGVVGSELVRLMRARARQHAGRDALRLEIVSVLVRRPELDRGVPIAPELLTTDAAALLGADADVVVEAIGGIELPLEIARRALGAGRRLVTANKALIARHGPELAELARRNRTRVDFEAAVGGGVPVVRALRDSLAAGDPRAIRGILNGTTNFILSRLADGEGYDEALATAKRLGFAEADPTLDLSGADAADKIAILSWLAFGVDPAQLAVRTRGIASHADRIAADARALGGVARLVAETRLTGEQVTASVEPTIVSPRSELGRTGNERNVVQIETVEMGSVSLAGPGAGGSPTAAVLLSDLLRGARSIARQGPNPTVRVGTGDDQVAGWALSVIHREGVRVDLHQELTTAGIRAVRMQVDSGADVVRAILEPARWSRVARLEDRLVAAALEPVITRYAVGIGESPSEG